MDSGSEEEPADRAAAGRQDALLAELADLMPFLDRALKQYFRKRRLPGDERDHIQEVYLKVVTQVRAGQDIKSLTAYALKSAELVFHEECRKQNRQRGQVEIDDERESVTPNAERELVRREADAIVQRLLLRLHARERAIVDRVEIDGEDRKSVGQSLGINQNVLRITRFRALRKLGALVRQRIGGRGDAA